MRFRVQVRGHAALADGEMLPLVDTTNPAVPLPFGVHDDRKEDRRRFSRPVPFSERRFGERRGDPADGLNFDAGCRSTG